MASRSPSLSPAFAHADAPIPTPFSCSDTTTADSSPTATYANNPSHATFQAMQRNNPCKAINPRNPSNTTNKTRNPSNATTPQPQQPHRQGDFSTQELAKSVGVRDSCLDVGVCDSS